ncbi:hypothetical protein D5086_011068 [Populus alba]|uniref:Uncharacterized protein n=1 Tax=Populus alba TaxID=43335 RepID=A0ACC4CCR4_POPAL
MQWRRVGYTRGGTGGIPGHRFAYRLWISCSYFPSCIYFDSVNHHHHLHKEIRVEKSAAPLFKAIVIVVSAQQRRRMVRRASWCWLGVAGQPF